MVAIRERKDLDRHRNHHHHYVLRVFVLMSVSLWVMGGVYVCIFRVLHLCVCGDMYELM